MKRLSEHFTAAEFACRCGCGAAAVNADLVERLERVRSALCAPVRIVSGARCAARNAAVGGKPRSAHLTGHAADLAAGSGAERLRLVEAALAAGFRRIGVADSFIHVDVSPTLPAPSLWVY